ncbi:hypothetical protein PROFUN_10330 [Planoprotostelium fungivorum]|uniref:Acyltransferase 3 domain-containing protein n=1 Tax=Planoprotostelium fungivorum TaxID=1890364 RepID=A0A2P6NDY1_9EUKA|nr:hypothetical protein PROFUN_10330 [Planoprotostelium fungivorum]
MSDKVQTQNRIYFLDGLRGWAAFFVMFHHIGMMLEPNLFFPLRSVNSQRFPEASWWRNATPLWHFTMGHTCVLIFFILSGRSLLLAAISHNSIESIPASCVRRFPRIYIPVYASILFAAFFSRSGLVPDPKKVAQISMNDWMMKRSVNAELWVIPPHLRLIKRSYVDLWNNFLSSLITFIGPGSPYPEVAAGVLWTINTEMWGSLMTYGVGAILLTFRHRRMLFANFVLFYSIVFARNYGLFTIGLWFCFAAQEGYFKFQRLWVSLSLQLFLVSFLCIGTMGPQGPGYSLTESIHRILIKSQMGGDWKMGTFKWPHVEMWLAAMVIILLVEVSPLLQRLLSTKFSQWLGHISFGLYLTHGTVCTTYMAHTYLRYNVSPWLAGSYLWFCLKHGLTAMTLAFFVASLFTEFVDQPSIKFARKFQLWLMEEPQPVRQLIAGTMDPKFWASLPGRFVSTIITSFKRLPLDSITCLFSWRWWKNTTEEWSREVATYWRQLRGDVKGRVMLEDKVKKEDSV